MANPDLSSFRTLSIRDCELKIFTTLYEQNRIQPITESERYSMKLMYDLFKDCEKL